VKRSDRIERTGERVEKKRVALAQFVAEAEAKALAARLAKRDTKQSPFDLARELKRWQSSGLGVERSRPEQYVTANLVHSPRRRERLEARRNFLSVLLDEAKYPKSRTVNAVAKRLRLDRKTVRGLLAHAARVEPDFKALLNHLPLTL